MDGDEEEEGDVAMLLRVLRDGAPPLRRFEPLPAALQEAHAALCSSRLVADVVHAAARSLPDCFDAHLSIPNLRRALQSHAVQLRGEGAGYRRLADVPAGAPHVRFVLERFGVPRALTPARALLFVSTYAADLVVRPEVVGADGSVTSATKPWTLRVPVPVGTAHDAHARAPHPRRPAGMLLLGGVMRALAAQLYMPAPNRLHLRFRASKRGDISGFVVGGNVGDEHKLVLRLETPRAPKSAAAAAAAAALPTPAPFLVAHVKDGPAAAVLPLGALLAHLTGDVRAAAAFGARAAARGAPRSMRSAAYRDYVRAAFAAPIAGLDLAAVRAHQKWAVDAAATALLPGMPLDAKLALLEKWGAEVARAACATAAAGSPCYFQDRDHDTNMYVATGGRFVRDLVETVWRRAVEHSVAKKLAALLGTTAAVTAEDVLKAVEKAGEDLGVFALDDAAEPGALQKRIRSGVTNADLGRRYKNMPQVRRFLGVTAPRRVRSIHFNKRARAL